MIHPLICTYNSVSHIAGTARSVSTVASDAIHQISSGVDDNFSFNVCYNLAWEVRSALLDLSCRTLDFSLISVANGECK